MLPRMAVVPALVLLLTADAGAQTRVFGVNLNRPANTRFDCSVYPGPDAFGNPIAYPSFATTCTWTSGGSIRSSRESLIVPVGRGTITRVRVRQGPVTGPMRVVVLEALRSGGRQVQPGVVDVACCKQVAQTRVFTPARNRVTTLRTSLRVRNSGVVDPRTGFAYFDMLAVSVLRPGVPPPLSATGNYTFTGIGATVFAPALRNGEERAGGAGVIGFVTLLNATWVRRR
jgi:hypothetical protein